MKFIRYIHAPKVVLEFSENECIVMMMASNRHFDPICRAFSENNGPLALLTKSIAERQGEPAKIRLSLTELGTLRYMLEPYHGSPTNHLRPLLYNFVNKAIEELNAEFDRVNIK